MRPPITNDDLHLAAEALEGVTPASLWQRLPRNGRIFVRFWGGVSLLALLAGIGLQEWASRHHSAINTAPQNKPNVTEQAPVVATAKEAAEKPPVSVADNTQPDKPKSEFSSEITPGVAPISQPMPDMLEAVAGDPGHSLPKRGPNGEMPRNVYAAAVPPIPAGNARIAILLDGYGLSEEMSLNAARNLPAMVSFAVPAYAPARLPLSETARLRGHEIFLSLPMQPSTAPLDDEGPRALGYDHTAAADKDNLEWALSRFNGYVGVTNAFSGLDGDAFAQSPDFAMVSHALESRGLLYLNATPGAPRTGPVMGGDASLTMDTNTDAAGVDGQLARLVAMAKSRGTAIAVAGPMRPVFLQRLTEWTHTLSSQGVTLVPVSALSRNATLSPSLSDSRTLHVAVPMASPQASVPSVVPKPAKIGTASGKRSVTEAPLDPPSSAPARDNTPTSP
ncbi:MAG: divergent polysaccharide deacetylase family protein [Acetobacter aceti]|uniref:Divergent polysaccharide deacetylase family protein n=1 Tax=Acetobacter aceti TaxID=435 RepID=A0A1U9KG20_ACEAC|nr:divergent polysaccharide deacetylase family protein [Acetobacter aceti]AQS84753.1 hypothetical protein A0U92_08145 [Acetobacter aceti]